MSTSRASSASCARTRISCGAPEDQPDRNPLLLKLFLADGADADDAILLEHVREKRRAAEQLRDELVELEAAGAGEMTPYAGFTREYGRRWAEMMIGWTTEVERVLARRASAPRR